MTRLYVLSLKGTNVIIEIKYYIKFWIVILQFLLSLFINEYNRYTVWNYIVGLIIMYL